MSPDIHPVANHHLPAFITAPGEIDILLKVVMLFLLAIFIAVILLYFRLHALPEHIAHRGEKIQYQLVAVLALISLFTHNHIFWIAGLLLALISVPDFTTPLMSMSESLAKMAAGRPAAPNLEPVPTPGRPIPYPHKTAGE
jgi:hypothetical protein